MSLHVEGKLAAAVQAAMSGVQNPKKDSINPHFKNRYASLEEVIAVIRPALQAHGLVLLQHPGTTANGCVELHTTLIHQSGEAMTWTMTIPLGTKVDPQSMGSAISYARRYSLLSLFCLAAEDDDGEGAQGRGTPGVSPVKAISTMSAQELRLVAAACKARAEELGIQRTGEQGPTKLETQLQASLKERP